MSDCIDLMQAPVTVLVKLKGIRSCSARNIVELRDAKQLTFEALCDACPAVSAVTWRGWMSSGHVIPDLYSMAPDDASFLLTERIGTLSAAAALPLPESPTSLSEPTLPILGAQRSPDASVVSSTPAVLKPLTSLSFSPVRVTSVPAPAVSTSAQALSTPSVLNPSTSSQVLRSALELNPPVTFSAPKPASFMMYPPVLTPQRFTTSLTSAMRPPISSITSAVRQPSAYVPLQFPIASTAADVPISPIQFASVSTATRTFLPSAIPKVSTYAHYPTPSPSVSIASLVQHPPPSRNVSIPPFLPSQPSVQTSNLPAVNAPVIGDSPELAALYDSIVQQEQAMHKNRMDLAKARSQLQVRVQELQTNGPDVPGVSRGVADLQVDISNTRRREMDAARDRYNFSVNRIQNIYGSDQMPIPQQPLIPIPQYPPPMQPQTAFNQQSSSFNRQQPSIQQQPPNFPAMAGVVSSTVSSFSMTPACSSQSGFHASSAGNQPPLSLSSIHPIQYHPNYLPPMSGDSDRYNPQIPVQSTPYAPSAEVVEGAPTDYFRPSRSALRPSSYNAESASSTIQNCSEGYNGTYRRNSGYSYENVGVSDNRNNNSRSRSPYESRSRSRSYSSSSRSGRRSSRDIEDRSERRPDRKSERRSHRRSRRDDDESSDSSEDSSHHDSSNDSSSPSSSSCSESDSQSRSRSRRHYSPKLTKYDGSELWDPFFYQFQRIAKRHRWSERKRFDKLIDSLRGNALSYVTKLNIRHHDFDRLKRKMRKHFQIEDLPMTARLNLRTLEQQESETLETFADRVLDAVMIGYAGFSESHWNRMAIEAFILGCSCDEAKRVVLNKKPRSLDRAVQLVKQAEATQSIISNKSSSKSKKSKPDYSVRQTKVDSGNEPEKQVRFQNPPVAPNSPSLFVSVEILSKALRDLQKQGPSDRPRFPSPNRPRFNSPDRSRHSERSDQPRYSDGYKNVDIRSDRSGRSPERQRNSDYRSDRSPQNNRSNSNDSYRGRSPSPSRRFTPPSSPRDKSRIQCHNCGIYGHYARECNKTAPKAPVLKSSTPKNDPGSGSQAST